jgi:predicted DCC family thiol-disulfide oxidoreductase YuxK
VSAIVLFDGVCNLCSGAVQFIVERDPRARFKFASIQSDSGKELMREHGIAIPSGDPTSIVLVEDGRAFQKSSAAVRIARGLRFPWSLLAASWIVPRFVRDWVYGIVARNRYRWFGKKEVCMVPTPELRARFL